MQTFLAYPDFGASARVLDSARLGKQRLEALQALRALVLPVYGWSNHPAARMWRGHVPALTRYTLTMIEEWTARGNADSLFETVLEFAPQVATARQDALEMPPWVGDEAFHRSHQSNLVRKFAEHYRPHFADVADDLPYVWPEPTAEVGVDAPGARAPGAGVSAPLPILRAKTTGQAAEWTATGIVTLPNKSPSGRRAAAWVAQEASFAALEAGDRLAIATPGAQRLPTGVVLAAPSGYRSGDDEGLRVSMEFDGELARSDFPHPVLLQDPRTFFSTAGPA